jgi:hypothetical protein
MFHEYARFVTFSFVSHPKVKRCITFVTELMNALFQGVVIRLHIYVDSLICLAMVHVLNITCLLTVQLYVEIIIFFSLFGVTLIFKSVRRLVLFQNYFNQSSILYPGSVFLNKAMILFSRNKNTLIGKESRCFHD